MSSKEKWEDVITHSSEREEKNNPLTLKPITPPTKYEAEYKSRLKKMLRLMNVAVLFYIIQGFERSYTIDQLWEVLEKQRTKWLKQFDNIATKQTPKEINKLLKHIDRITSEYLKRQGVMIKLPPLVGRDADIFKIAISENVRLIKSIPEEYFNNVQRIISTGFQNGQGITYITQEIQKRYKLSTTKASFIASDQTAKITENLTRMRLKSIGITEGIWLHHPELSKMPRASHRALNGKRYPLDKGLYDSEVGKKIFPAELPGCKCTFRAIIPQEMITKRKFI